MARTMRDETVVVTGGAGELGQALAASFAADGYIVVVADIEPVREQERLMGETVDVANRDAVFALARRAATLGRLAAWVNAAGQFAPGRVREADEATWDRLIAVNLTGTFHGCAAALHEMVTGGGGRIVNVGSLSGQVGGTGVHPAYGAAKAGVHALTKSYALEGAKFGVACNAVAPGVLEGRMGGQLSDRQRAGLAAANPLRRLGTMTDAVEAIRFLADRDRAAYVNGVILPVNGGAYMPG